MYTNILDIKQSLVVASVVDAHVRLHVVIIDSASDLNRNNEVSHYDVISLV